VMAGGRITGELARDHVTEEQILALAMDEAAADPDLSTSLS